MDKGKRVLMFDVMAEGHGVKNWCATLQSKAFSDFAKNNQVFLVIPTLLKERLVEELGVATEWSCEDVIDVKGLENYHNWKGRVFTLRILVKQLGALKCNHLFAMYSDPIMPFFGFLRLLFPFLHIGLLSFRALIHYPECGFKFGANSDAERRRALFKNRLLYFFLRMHIVNLVMFQDDGAVKWFQYHGCRAAWSATCMVDDSLQDLQSAARNKTDDKDRKRITLFGGLARRKGVFTLLDAWEHLPADVKRRGELRLIGRCVDTERPEIHSRIQQIRDSNILFEDRFVPNDEIRDIYSTTDAILLIYEGALVGTSGVLVQAAAWGVPVIATDIGWLGYTVRERRLGFTYDSDNPLGLRKVLEKAILNPIPFDKESAYYMAQANTPERFGEQIMKSICEM